MNESQYSLFLICLLIIYKFFCRYVVQCRQQQGKHFYPILFFFQLIQDIKYVCMYVCMLSYALRVWRASYRRHTNESPASFSVEYTGWSLSLNTLNQVCMYVCMYVPDATMSVRRRPSWSATAKQVMLPNIAPNMPRDVIVPCHTYIHTYIHTCIHRVCIQYLIHK